MSENYSELREFLDINTKRGKWEAVVKKYAECPEAHELKLTQQEETALHLAVLDYQEDIVERLIKLICRTPHYQRTLEATNERANSPLHLAAALGSARMCHLIASAHEKLVDARNKDDETPLFLAATNGHKNAFYCLYYFCANDQISANCRERKNGDTVLHSALRNEHFDLAFQLIHLNDESVNWVNTQGITPLHVLASTPTAFKSGVHTRGWRNIVYHCAFVDELRPRPIETLSKAWKKKGLSKAKKIPTSFPDNYETCIAIFLWLRDAIFRGFSILFGPLKNKKNSRDAEKDVNVESENSDTHESQESSENFPENYSTCINFFRLVFSAIINILGFGYREVSKIVDKKRRHTWSVQVMEKLVLGFCPPDKYGNDGSIPMGSRTETDGEAEFSVPYTVEGTTVTFNHEYVESEPDLDSAKNVAQETAMLLAAKNGVIEMVMRLLEQYPLAVLDTRKSDKKNAVLLAVEYRQPEVYRFLLERKHSLQSLFRAVDNEGNSALHLAAAAPTSMLWYLTGAALQMQCEAKWFKFVEESMPLQFFPLYNKEGKTAKTIFHETHEEMVKKGQEWLTKTGTSCSVVATLIVTVAFATSTSVPGDTSSISGTPLLIKEQGFSIFAVCSVIAFSLSSTSVSMFLAILTSRFDAGDFGSSLTWKLLIGFSSLFFSIIFMLISFCAGHYFLIAPHLPNVAVPLYTITFIPVAFIFIVSKLPLYFDVLKAIFIAVPPRDANVAPSDPLEAPQTSASKLSGKFEVTLIRKQIKIDCVSLLIFTPTATTEDDNPYPLILFLPGCVESFHSAFLELIASHGFVVVAPQIPTTRTSEDGTKKTEATSQALETGTSWLPSDREMVEEKLSKLSLVGRSKGWETPFSLDLGFCDCPSPLFSQVFNPHPGTKFYIPESQIQTYASSNASPPDLQSELVISKLCGKVS